MDPGMKEFLEKYEEISQMEKNRDRNEYRTCQICKDASNLTKSQKEWPHVQSIGRIKQVRIPKEKDSQGILFMLPSSFCWRGSRERCPVYGTDIRPDPYSRGAGKHKKNALVNREPAPSCAGRYI